MTISRREFLERASALGLLATLPLNLTACSEDKGDGLPTYFYDGPSGPATTFEHGIASGDPLTDAVILWTRISVGSLAVSEVSVFVEVATDPSFSRRVLAERVTTDASRDFTVRVDATNLSPGTTYYYRFYAFDRMSLTGRTRTAPQGDVSRLRLAFVACSNVGAGWFYAYRHLTKRADLDAIVHLGDYIYEYGISEQYGEVYGDFRKDLDPPGQCVSRDEYRRRYAYYRRDPDLAELHRQNPFIHVWDDHEFADDPHPGGAVNHHAETQGPWTERIANALAAYTDWMPTRLADGGRIFRHLKFGDLADLVLVDRQRRFIFPAAEDGDEYLGKEQQAWLDARIAEGKGRWLLLGTGTTFGSDEEDMISGASWDAVSRERVLAACEAAGRTNLVVVTGDIHRMEALEIVRTPATYAVGTGTGAAGVEFSTGSITSPGKTQPTKAPQFVWNDGFSKGFLVLDLTKEAARADFFGHLFLENGESDYPEEQFLAGFVCNAGSRALVRSETPAPARTDAPVLAPKDG